MTSNKPQGMFSLHRRGIRVLSAYIPHFFTAITLHSLVAATMPYISAWLLAMTIDRIALEDEVGAWLWALLTMTVGATLILFEGVLKRWKESKWECLYRVADRIVSDALLSLDHADLDDSDTKDQLRRIRSHMTELDYGLVRLPQTVQHILLGVFGSTAAAILAVNVWLRADIHVEPLLLAGCAAVMTAAAVFSWILKNIAEQHRDTKTDEVVELDRMYYTLYGTMFDAAKAADVRMYRQDEAIEQALNRADRAFFDKQGLKRQGFGKRGLAKALAEALFAPWLFGACVMTAIAAASWSIGACVQHIAVLALVWGALDELCEGVRFMRKNTAYLLEILTFLNRPHRLYQGSLTTEKRADRDYEIEFRHVTFSYPSATAPAVRDVNVVLRAGSRTAIVGENGSGKSTFVKLLCRLYDPDEGEILLNGIDIRKYRYADYMDIIAAVLQDFRLSSQPLGNVVAGASQYDRERVTACLQHVSFDVGCLPDGLDTPLSQNSFACGVSISRGDAQKIAMARALYKNAPFMILDEPTASLDPVTEAQIYADFDRIAEDRTTLYVSHRLSSCRFCREILVFDRGTIVQRGTHEELLADSGGKYRELWYAQADYYKT